MRRLFTLLLVAAVGAGCGGLAPPGDEPAAPPPVRVLFVGNSLTATNDLPATVAALAGGRLEYRTVAPGGVNLEDHWRFTGARDALLAERWDWVVMQQGPSSLPESQADLKKWARTWANAIRARGARPALLTVWPEADRFYAFDAVVRSYRNAATATRSRLLPAGEAWLEAWRRQPRLALYGADAFHPSVLGTYLAAVVVWSGLSGARPVGLPALGLPEGVALALQQAASRASRR
jgi:hypothetical protein